MPQLARRSPQIFVCYRRDDPDGHTGRLGDYLHARFGDKNVFMDVEKVRPGQDFTKVIDEALAKCEVLLAVIDQAWLTRVDENGQRRLDNPADYVRLEIITAFRRRLGIIPVVLPGARMPQKEELPEELRELSITNAVIFSAQPGHWKHDAGELARAAVELAAERREKLRKEEERRRREERQKASLLKKVLLRVLDFISLPLIIVPVAWVLYSQATVKKSEIPLVRVEKPKGAFQMRLENVGVEATPTRSVTFSEPFYVGKHQVTQREWKDLMGDDNNPSQNEGNDLPVDGITLAEAHDFIHRLNAQGTGYQFSLPTEAEWEYACKGWSSGDAIMDEPAAAESYPSAFTLYKHESNVWEWCEDDYHESYDDAPKDGIFAWTGNDKDSPGVARIAEFDSAAKNFRCSSRRSLPRDERRAAVGLRVVAYEPIKTPPPDLRRLIIFMLGLAIILLAVSVKMNYRRLINFSKSWLGRLR